MAQEMTEAQKAQESADRAEEAERKDKERQERQESWSRDWRRANSEVAKNVFEPRDQHLLGDNFKFDHGSWFARVILEPYAKKGKGMIPEYTHAQYERVIGVLWWRHISDIRKL